jgi:DNA-binding NarL/FixJ family response regulator/two-component sensor histidine kinase
MVAILRNLDAIQAGAAALPEALRERVSQARDLARESLDEARRSVWNLQPAALDHATLREALERHLATWSPQTGVRTKFEQKGHPVPLDSALEGELLLIAREALNNVARHAHAATVRVTLLFGPAGLRLVISDDGAGFDTQARGKVATDEHAHGGLGLKGMRERARLLGAWLQVESAPGWGTRVALTVPLAGLRRGIPGNAFLGIVPELATEEVAHVPEADVPLSDATLPHGATAPRVAGSAIEVLLVDDHPALREGLRQALAAVVDVRVVGTAATGREAVALAREFQPDIVLLDLQLREEDGLAVVRQLRGEAVAARIVIFTAHDDDAHVAAALQAGAAGYLRKDTEMPQVVAAIRAVAAGRRVFSPAIADRLRGRAGLLTNPQTSYLTEREREVLALLAEGLRYRAIGLRLCLAEATVKFHVLNLYQKLQSSSRVQALNRAREWGLLR